MKRLSRPTALKIAAVLSFLLGLYGIVSALPYLDRGAADLSQAGDAPPYLVILLGFALSIVRIVAAFGNWQNQRWGIVLTLLANALVALTSMPGILYAPTTYLRVSATITTLLAIVIIALCFWREQRDGLT